MIKRIELVSVMESLVLMIMIRVVIVHMIGVNAVAVISEGVRFSFAFLAHRATVRASWTKRFQP